MPSVNRRRFLQAAAAATAGIAVGPARARAQVAGANDKVRVGLIGCGVRGSAYFGIADWLCDPDANRLGKAAADHNVPTSQTTADLRRILDSKDVDAVIIATPDHWHAPAALLALEAGKHVYVEKPCSHNFHESQLLVAAAKRSGLVVQHGTQQRSRPFIADAVAQLRDGVIGDVLSAKAWDVQRRQSIGHELPAQPPAGVDYDLWVGPAEMQPFQANRFHSSWHWWYNFGTGDIGNDGAHELDYARWGLGVDGLPARISAVGGKYFFDDDQQFPDTATCVFEYDAPGAPGSKKQLVFEMRLWTTTYPLNCDSGVEFYGTKGTLFLSKRGKLRLTGGDNQILRDERANDNLGLAHVDDFYAAIRDGKRPNAGIEEAHRSVALSHLANVSLRVGRSLAFDGKTETVIDDREANALLRRTYRDGGHWAVPREA